MYLRRDIKRAGFVYASQLSAVKIDARRCISSEHQLNRRAIVGRWTYLIGVYQISDFLHITSIYSNNA